VLRNICIVIFVIFSITFSFANISNKHMFNNKNLANSVDTLTDYAEGNTELTPYGVSVTTVHEGRKARASLNSWETMRGSRNDYPPVRVLKVTECKMDKIDIKQFAVKMMDKLSDDAGQQMKIYIDEEVLGEVYADAAAANKGIAAGRKSSAYNLGTTANAIPLTKSNIVDYIMMAEAVGDEQNWPEEGRWMVLPTWAKFLMNTSELKDASLTGEDKSILIRGGRIGRLGNFMLHVTNLYTPVVESGHNNYNITFGHKEGLTFAAQLTEMEYFEKLENTYGSGMKGLNVYGFKTMKTDALGVLYAYKG